MPVRLRLSRFGRKVFQSFIDLVKQAHSTLTDNFIPFQAEPFYRIFVADARAPRDGKHIDVVGHFDPIPGGYTCMNCTLVGIDK